MPMLVTFEDLQSNLVESDFDPALDIHIEYYKTNMKTYKIKGGAKDYMDIKDPERFEIAVARQPSVNKEFLDYFPNLKLVHIIGHGFECCDLEEIKKRGIVLAGCSGLYSGHMAEDVIMRMIMLSRHTLQAMEKQRSKIWELERPLPAMEGSTVTILGAGSIGQNIAKRLSTFGMTIRGVVSHKRPLEYFDEVYGADEMKEAVKNADFVVDCLREDATTNNVVNEELISAMKDGVYFINVGRGSTVDEDALIAALKSKKIAAASSDVFKKEPLPAESEFWTLPNFFLTPHNSGGHHIGAGDDRRKWISANVTAFLTGGELKGRIV